MPHSSPPEPGFTIRDGVPRRVPTILVVDDDPRFLSRMRAWLDDRGFQVICTETSKAALSSVQSTPVDVALIDYRLRGREDGLSLARTLSREHGIPFILVSGFLSTRVTVQAMRVGAADVLDKPLTAECVVEAISRTIGGNAAVAPLTVPLDDLDLWPWAEDDSPAQRLARLVLRACEAKRDPRKMSLFAKAAVVSSAVLRTACDLCRIKPHDACDLGGVLRAVGLSAKDNSLIISHFSVGDPRTAERLMRRAGLDPSTRRIELYDFLHRQTLVDISSEFVRELGHFAANSPLFFPKDE